MMSAQVQVQAQQDLHVAEPSPFWASPFARVHQEGGAQMQRAAGVVQPSRPDKGETLWHFAYNELNLVCHMIFNLNIQYIQYMDYAGCRYAVIFR